MVPSEFQTGPSSVFTVWVALLESRERKEPKELHLQREHCCAILAGLLALHGALGMELSCPRDLLMDISPRECSKGLAISTGGAAEDKCQAKRR